MDREQKRKQRVQLRCLKKLDKKEEKLLEERNPSLIAQKAGEGQPLDWQAVQRRKAAGRLSAICAEAAVRLGAV